MGRFGWLVKLALSVTLIGALISRYPISLAEVIETFARIHVPVMGVAVALLFNQYVISAGKWSLILHSHAIHVPFARLIRTYMISHFFATFLPSSYMGDFFRVAHVARVSGRTFESASAVVLERISGLVALTAIGSAASVAVAQRQGDPAFLTLAVLLLAGMLALVAVFVPGALKALRAIVRRVPLALARRAFEKVAAVVMHYRRRPRLLVRILLLSFAFHIQTYTIVYLYAWALGLEVPFAYCLAFLPVIYLLEALPISIGGFGPREGGLVYFLGKLGIDASGAISLSVLIVTMRYAMNLTGGLLYALRGRQGDD